MSAQCPYSRRFHLTQIPGHILSSINPPPHSSPGPIPTTHNPSVPTRPGEHPPVIALLAAELGGDGVLHRLMFGQVVQGPAQATGQRLTEEHEERQEVADVSIRVTGAAPAALRGESYPLHQ